MKRSILFGLASIAGFSFCLRNTSSAQLRLRIPTTMPRVQMIVTVQSKHHEQPAPNVEKQDIAVRERTRAKVVSWLPLKGQDAAMQLFVVLDNSSRTNAIGTHIGELQSFMHSLPPTVSVAVGYMTNGRV